MTADMFFSNLFISSLIIIRARAVNYEGPIVFQGVIVIIIIIVYMDFAPFLCAQVHQSRQGRQAWGRVRFSGVSPMDDARWLCGSGLIYHFNSEISRHPPYRLKCKNRVDLTVRSALNHR